MAAAAAAAAAMAPPGCPGSCPNFAVVCSFLERYGPLLDLPELPFPELERVLQAPPPDVGNGEGKRGGPNARREAALACSFSLLPTDTPGLRGSVLPLRRSSARPVSSAQPPGVSGSGEAGRRPRRANSARRPAEVGASWSGSGLGAGGGGGSLCWSAAPGATTPRWGPGPSPLLPLGGGGRGAQVPASFALFSSTPPSLPPLLPPSSLLSRGRLGSSSLGAPFSPSTWVGGGQRTLHLSLPLVGTPPRESRLRSPFPSPPGPL